METFNQATDTKIRTAVVEKLQHLGPLFVSLKAADKHNSGKVVMSLDELVNFFDKTPTTIHRWIEAGSNKGYFKVLRENNLYCFYLKSWDLLKKELGIDKCIDGWISLNDLRNHNLKYITASLVAEIVQTYKRKEMKKTALFNNDRTKFPQPFDILRDDADSSVLGSGVTCKIKQGNLTLLLVKDFFPQFQIAQCFIADWLGVSKKTIQRRLRTKKKVQVCVKDRDMSKQYLNLYPSAQARYFLNFGSYYRRSGCIYDIEFTDKEVGDITLPVVELPRPLTPTADQLPSTYTIDRTQQFKVWKKKFSSNLDYNWFINNVDENGVNFLPTEERNLQLTKGNTAMLQAAGLLPN